MKKASHLHKLNPVLEGSIVQVGGRLSRAAMPDEARHPAILARDLHISDLVPGVMIYLLSYVRDIGFPVLVLL